MSRKTEFSATSTRAAAAAPTAVVVVRVIPRARRKRFNVCENERARGG